MFKQIRTIVDNEKHLKAFVIFCCVFLIFMAFFMRIQSNTNRLSNLAVDEETGWFAIAYPDKDAKIVEVYNENFEKQYQRRIINPSGGGLYLTFEDKNLKIYLYREDTCKTYNATGDLISSQKEQAPNNSNELKNWERNGNTYTISCCGNQYFYEYSSSLQNLIKNECTFSVRDKNGDQKIIWSAD